MEPIPLPNSNTHARIQKDISLIPIIDNHAHNILKTYDTPAEYPREMLVSEATAGALNDSVYSLAHMRMIKHLARFLNLPEYASWQEVQATAKTMDYEVLCRNLVRSAGIQLILFDDGIANDHCHPLAWHNQLTPLPNKRIVRIETLFEAIMNREKETHSLQSFVRSIIEYVKDPQVVGFKSIAAYRSGLDIEPRIDLEQHGAAVEQIVTHQLSSSGKFRVDHPEVVGWIINATLKAISGSGKPLQFHTGLGDNDISLVKSDASLLQPLIKAYPDVTFVLLHSGYPYARQVGYLATVYANVYLDFGLAIPLLSGDGQRSMLRQMIELCPTNKLLWSSDTAFHPERFYLAALQTREALSELLAQSIDRHELSYEEGLQIAKRIFFHNSNRLYSLGVEYTQLGPSLVEGSDLGSPAFVTTSLPDAPEQAEPSIKEVDTSPNLVPGYFSRPTHSLEKLPNNTLKDSISLIKSRGIQFVRVTWVDYVNLIRYRVIPIEHFESLVGVKFDSWSSNSEQLAESGLSLIRGAIGLGVQDSLPSGVSTSKDFTLKPDFSTMWRAPFMPSHAYVMGRFFEKSYAGGEESVICPRSVLRRVVQRAEREYKSRFLVGFETEFILLDRDDKPARTGAWSVSRKLQCGPVADCVHDIAQSIIDAGIKLEMYHAESASGQYEVVTGHLPPVQAADALVATREIIYNVAEKHGFRATLAPRVFSNQGGSACHMHISVQSPHSDTPSDHPDLPSLPSDLASFMAGLLSHLRSVCAFTLPVDASYDRVVDGAWTGGTWACWGRENKEAPLRLCGFEGTFNVELKAFDGIANPYLALAAVLAAGSIGLANQQVLEMRNCTAVAAKLTEEQRSEMRITTQMPTESVVFEPDSKERTDYINTWLPSEAWELYKAVRKDERNQILLSEPMLRESGQGGHTNVAHARFFKNYY